MPPPRISLRDAADGEEPTTAAVRGAAVDPLVGSGEVVGPAMAGGVDPAAWVGVKLGFGVGRGEGRGVGRGVDCGVGVGVWVGLVVGAGVGAGAGAVTMTVDGVTDVRVATTRPFAVPLVAEKE